MDNTNLLAVIPPTDDGVLVPNLNEPVTPPQSRGLLVTFWRDFRTAVPDGGVRPDVFTICCFVGAFVHPLIGLGLFALLAYVEGTVLIEENCPDVILWFRRLWRGGPTPIPPYAEAVAMLQASPNAIERNSLLIGKVFGTEWPVLPPDSLAEENIHIMGPTRIGKSKTTKLPLAKQQIAKSKYVVISFDLGGDETDIHELREAAEQAGVPFYLFTIDPTKLSHVFNPLTQSHLSDDPLERSAMITQGLGLSTGSQEYGEWWFQDCMELVADREFEEFGRPTIRETVEEITKLDLSELARRLRLTPHKLQSGEHLNIDLEKAATHSGTERPGI